MPNYVLTFRLAQVPDALCLQYFAKFLDIVSLSFFFFHALLPSYFYDHEVVVWGLFCMGVMLEV